MMTVGMLAYLLAVAPASAQQTPIDPDRLGPQVGARVPDFAGTDQRGRTQTLESLMGREGLMLVFNRSADW
jgi:cytochrome oxidase Cu insertion factor (SCO1/SenC/PrrC family)